MVQRPSDKPDDRRRAECVCLWRLAPSRCGFAESKSVSPNIALRQSIQEFLDKRPRMKQLKQTELDLKSLELAIKLREEEVARMQ